MQSGVQRQWTGHRTKKMKHIFCEKHGVGRARDEKIASLVRTSCLIQRILLCGITVRYDDTCFYSTAHGCWPTRMQLHKITNWIVEVHQVLRSRGVRRVKRMLKNRWVYHIVNIIALCDCCLFMKASPLFFCRLCSRFCACELRFIFCASFYLKCSEAFWHWMLY